MINFFVRESNIREGFVLSGRKEYIMDKYKVKKILKKYTPNPLLCIYSLRHSTTEMKAYHQGQKAISAFKTKKRQAPRIIFIIQFPEVWNSVRTIYEEAYSQGMKPILLCIPKPFDNGVGEYSINKEGKNDAFDFFNQLGINALNSYDEKNMTWMDLQSLSPDYVIYSRPYNNQYPKKYQSSEVCKYAKVCYVPYAFSQTDGTLFETTFNTKFISTVYMTFVPSRIRLDDCRKKFVIQYWLKTNQFVYCGFPRFDLLVRKEFGKQTHAKDQRTIAWLPRWIVDDGVENKKSNFFKYCDDFIRYMEEHQEKQLIIRPHPLMFESIIENGIMKEVEVEQLKARLLSHDNIRIDTDKDYLPTLRDSDILVADFTSLLIEYFVTGKPIIYCDTAEEFNADAQLMDSTLYHAKNWKELEGLLSQSEDVMYSKREQVIDYLMPPNAGHIGRDILSYIVENFQK